MARGRAWMPGRCPTGCDRVSEAPDSADLVELVELVEAAVRMAPVVDSSGRLRS